MVSLETRSEHIDPRIAAHNAVIEARCNLLTLGTQLVEAYLAGQNMLQAEDTPEFQEAVRKLEIAQTNLDNFTSVSH
jgi:hypothetical protein